MENLLITNGWIVTMDGQRQVIEQGYVWIEGDRIRDVGQDEMALNQWAQQADRVLDAQGKIVMPGMVNGHTHLFQTYLRGLGDDKPLLQWLREEVWPFSAAMEEDDFYLAGLLGCIENIKCGATSVIDQHYIHTTEGTSDRVLQAMTESGIRGTLCRTFSNYNYTPLLQEEDEVIMESLARLTSQYHGSQNGRLGIAVGPINPWGCTEDLYKRTYAYAREHGLKYQIHTAETQSVVERCLEMYGKRNVPFFEDLGILGEDTQLAHGIWLDDDELDRVERHGATVVHCPVANMYLADGVARIPEMRKRGIPVALGTDGPGSNNAQDMMEVLKMGACLHKVTTLDPMVLQPEDMIEMACAAGSALLGRDDLGRLIPGYKADLILVDWKKPHIAPVHKPASAVVYNANGNDVHTTIVDGKIVMEDRKIQFADEAALIDVCQERIGAIRRRLV